MRVHPIYRALRLTAIAALAVACVAAPASAALRQQKEKRPKIVPAQRLVEEKTGVLTTREGLRLRVVTDIGDVRILTLGPGATSVSYKVRLETDSHDADAQTLVKQFSLSASTNPTGVQLTGQVPWHGFHGRLWVTYEITVPRRYNLDVTTQVGNIETQDVDGRVSLVTFGGNIGAGRIGGAEGTARLAMSAGTPVARLETQGGHITVQDVNGSLRAVTAGGHINAGNILGDALLRTGGGNVRAGTIRGVAQLETGGGNIAIQRAGGSVNAASAGGQIDFGEASGSIRAHTAGGAIHVLRVFGPMQLASNSGSIYLPQVRGNVRASTGAGTITAWFVPQEGGLLAVAPVIVAPNSVTSPAPAAAGRAGNMLTPSPTPAAATPPWAGGAIAPAAAPPVKPGAASTSPALAGVLAPMATMAPRKWKLLGASQLESTQGDIVVYIPRELAVTIEAVVEFGGEHVIDADPSMPMKFTYVESGGNKTVKGECSLNGGGDVLYLKTTSGNIHVKVADAVAQEALYKRQLGEVQRRLALDQQRLFEQLKSAQVLLQIDQAQIELQFAQQLKQVQEQQAKQAEQVARDASRTTTWFWPWPEALTGVTSVDPDEQQKKLVFSVRPAYPDELREGGLEGMVRLRAVIGPDGAVRSLRVVSGDVRLAAAAMNAVRQWRYQPTLVDNKPVSVATTVSIQFKLE
jgi:TonB family protein